MAPWSGMFSRRELFASILLSSPYWFSRHWDLFSNLALVDGVHQTSCPHKLSFTLSKPWSISWLQVSKYIVSRDLSSHFKICFHWCYTSESIRCLRSWRIWANLSQYFPISSYNCIHRWILVKVIYNNRTSHHSHYYLQACFGQKLAIYLQYSSWNNDRIPHWQIPCIDNLRSEFLIIHEGIDVFILKQRIFHLYRYL